MTYCDFTDLAVDQCSHCTTGVSALERTEKFARAQMALHGLHQWNFKWDSAKTRLGQCRHRDQTITMSRHWAEVRDFELTKTTVLHEIAHALVGPGHSHNHVWAAKARELGITPARCGEVGEARLEKAVRGTCSQGHTVEQHRLPRRVQSCSQCCRFFNPDHLFTWSKDGKPAVMGQAYQDEYRRIMARAR